MTLSPRHFGSHSLGRRGLFMTAGEIMGLVLLPPHPRNEVGVRGLTASPFYSCSSATGTLTALTLRTTHRQEGLPQTQDCPWHTGLCPFPVDSTGWPEGVMGCLCFPQPGPRLQAHPAQRLLSYLSQLSETRGSGTFILAEQSETAAHGPHSKYPELSQSWPSPPPKKSNLRETLLPSSQATWLLTRLNDLGRLG